MLLIHLHHTWNTLRDVPTGNFLIVTTSFFLNSLKKLHKSVFFSFMKWSGVTHEQRWPPAHPHPHPIISIICTVARNHCWEFWYVCNNFSNQFKTDLNEHNQIEKRQRTISQTKMHLLVEGGIFFYGNIFCKKRRPTFSVPLKVRVLVPERPRLTSLLALYFS